MRCYFIRDNKIEYVELLKPGPDDELIRQANELVRQRRSIEFDRVEVWEGRRFVYRYPERDQGRGTK